MKGKLFALATLASAMAGYNEYGNNVKSGNDITEKDIEKLREERKRKAWDIKKSNGLKEYNIEGYTVLALNEKNALRKVANLKRNL